MWAAWELLERGATVALLEAGLRPRAERAQRRVLRVDVAVRRRRCASASATSAPGRCWTRPATPCPRSAPGAPPRAWTPGSTSPATCACPRPRRSTRSAWARSRRRRRSGRPSGWSRCREAEVAERCASPRFRGAVHIPDFATLQPARLALGLRRRLIERGVQVYERSRCAESARPRRDRLRQREGRRGRARGRPGARARSHGCAPRLTVTSSHIVLTEPVPDVIAELGWTGGECITDGRTLVHYFRTTRDGRILLGWGGGRLAYGSRVNGRVEIDQAAVARRPRRAGAALPGPRGAAGHARVGRSDRRLPEPHPPDRHPARQARPLRLRLHGQRGRARRTWSAARWPRSRPGADDLTRLALVGADAGAWVPPEPLTWLGGSVVRSALVRRERIEEDGRRPDPLTRAVCAAPRAIGMHLAR